MRATLSSLLLIAAALTGPAPLTAAPAGPPVDVVRVRLVKSRTGETVSRGEDPYSVRRTLGSPHKTLSSDVWVYRGYYPAEDTVPSFGGHTLLITFARDKVSDLHLVNPRAERILAAHLRTKTAPVTIADIAKPTTAKLP
ncbi:MAG: hypothetical protein IPL39_21515 [Opitutaceae bacterium]|nr:hypothetical protein [Opitutaceae bacterium]